MKDDSEKEMELDDRRQRERFIAEPAIPGTFGAVDINIANLAENGAQVIHSRPMKLGLSGRLSFVVDGRRVSVPAHVVWSRLSDRADAKGKLLYRSGIRLEPEDVAAREVLTALVKAQRLTPDANSLERKKEKLADKAKALASQPKMKVINVAPGVSADTLLLVQQARERLQTRPDEATKWYNRARYTIGEIGAQSMHHREEVVAIWEFLERTIDLETIAQALAQMKK